jgi:hypothetical protein
MSVEGHGQRNVTMLRATVACWMVAVLAIGPLAKAADDPSRVGSRLPQDVTVLVVKADRAREEGLLDDAEALYREVLAIDPEHETAFAELMQLAGRRPLGGDSTSYRATRDLLPRSFRRHETPHFVILSDAGRRWSRARGKLLEQTYTQFHRYATRLDLRPLPLRHKLVCVLFRKRSEFSTFARDNDGVTAAWCQGYYSPRADRMVFFNVESDRSADEFAEARAIAATVHEAIHHLHFHSGLQTDAVQYPLWSGEGLATAFETSAPEEVFGPDRDFRPRRERFQRLVEAERLIPLRSFVQLDRMPDDQRETVHTVYNQAYALASWLAGNRPEGLRGYLRSMRKEPPGRPVAERHLELFEQAFGDVDTVEEIWLEYEISRLDGQDNTRRPTVITRPRGIGSEDAP